MLRGGGTATSSARTIRLAEGEEVIDQHLARRLTTAARKGREWLSRRDALIVKAIEEGATQTEVAKLAGLSQPGVRDIVLRAASPPDQEQEIVNG